MSQQQDPNWLTTWLPWIVPIIAVGGVVRATMRRVFSIEVRHQENQTAIADLKKMLEVGSGERAEMRKDINRIAEDVAYLRGLVQ